jgi:hypothetical protein
MYSALACLSCMGVILSYAIPVVGGTIGTVVVCFSNGMILSMAAKAKCGKRELSSVELT